MRHIGYFIEKTAEQYESETNEKIVFNERAMEIFAELVVKRCLCICDEVCSSFNSPEYRIGTDFGLDPYWRQNDPNWKQEQDAEWDLH